MSKLKLPKRSVRRKAGIVVVFCLTIAILVWALTTSWIWNEVVPFFRSPPTDEEMISHFHSCRGSFEELARMFREDASLPGYLTLLNAPPEVKALMNRINVVAVGLDSEIWIPPDPYSTEAHRKMRELALLPWPETARELHGVELIYGHPRVESPEYIAPVTKIYYYCPIAPRIERQLLRLPWGGGIDMVQSLDTYPRGFAPQSTVVRQIDGQWFIRMSMGMQGIR